MAPAGGALRAMMAKNMSFLMRTYKKAAGIVKGQFPAPLRTLEAEAQPAYVHLQPRQSLSRAAFLQQIQRRGLATHAPTHGFARQYTTGQSAGHVSKHSRASLPKSKTGDAVNRFTGRAPFASALRPNLTGGTFSRTAGGYGLGGGRIGGARYFSHTPAAPAQVINNVSQALRAFLIGGNKAQFDGVNARTGEKRYKSVTTLQEKVNRKLGSLPKATPGSFIDFKVNPTITALTPLGAVAGYSGSKDAATLNSDGLLNVLSVDFSRALKDLAVILNDLQRLSRLGDLPITYRAAALRVHFPGCDAESVENLCDELGVLRGVVGQDEDFDAFVGTEIALLFPFAPGKTVSECSFYEKPIADRDRVQWQTMISPDPETLTSPAYSTKSDTGLDFEDVNGSPWLSSPSGYESLHSSEIEELPPQYEASERHSPLEYQGFEGIYRFIEQCDAARR